MTRVAKKSIKIASYSVALLTGAVLMLLGMNGKSNTLTEGELFEPLGSTVHADHIGGGDQAPWSGDDGDGGGGDAGGDAGGGDDGPN